MIKLLNAGFTRLRKSKIFWLLTIFSVILATFMIYSSFSNMKKYGDVIEVEQLMLNYSTMVGVVIAIFTSIFLGVEYSDGGIRNKISIGHKRTNIYLSNLVIATVTGIFSYILFILVVSIIGISLFGGITIAFSKLLMLLGSILVIITAYCSIFTFIAMLVSNKMITAIVSIMLSFGLMIFALTCLNILQTPKFIDSVSVSNSETGGIEAIKEPNPKYPSEDKKKVYQTLLDINPAGQSFQLAGRITPNLMILPIYSLSIIVIITGAGLFLFKRKEIK